MLDTHARGYVTPLIRFFAKGLLDLGFIPLHVTFFAGAMGVMGALLFVFQWPYFAVGLLWLSGTLDALDGEMARISKAQSDRGAMADLFLDRVVEVAFIGAFALTQWASMASLLLLSLSIILSITLFLSVGALSSKRGNKAFYYQAGLMERTEGFILFTLISIVPTFATELVYLFAFLIFITVAQRLIQAWHILDT